jgi:hypothetical protein
VGSYDPNSEKDPMLETACKSLPAQDGEQGKHEPFVASPVSKGSKSGKEEHIPSHQNVISNVEIPPKDFIPRGIEILSHPLLRDHDVTKSLPPDQKPKTNSQKQRDAIFGTSGDELSELSDTQSAAKTPEKDLPDQPFHSRKDSPLPDTVTAPRSKAKRVLDSDDEDENHKASTSKTGCKKKKKAYIIIDSASESGTDAVQVVEMTALAKDYERETIDLPEAPPPKGVARTLLDPSNPQGINDPHQEPVALADPAKLKPRQRKIIGKSNNSALEIAVEHSNEGAVDANRADPVSFSIESIDSSPREALHSVAFEGDLGNPGTKDGLSVSDAKQSIRLFRLREFITQPIYL